MKKTQQLFEELEAKQSMLESHPVFKGLRDISALRLFMSWHVFAVWDFMSLVKRLQCDLTRIELPWLPPKYPLAARLINDIVLAEESDEHPEGGFASHFELYLEAMREIGADTASIESLIKMLQSGESVANAVDRLNVAREIKVFIHSTLDTAMNGNIHQVLGSFFFGRENVIPDMFQHLLNSWHLEERDAPIFVYYLKRHIELDGDTHGPAARRMIKEIAGDDPRALTDLEDAATAAIDARRHFWDGLQTRLEGTNEQPKQVTA